MGYEDFLRATEAAALDPMVEGIYHIGDEQPVTLQDFLDECCRLWGYPGPRRQPLWSIYAAAQLVELFALVFRTPAPLTKDFITIGRVSYYGDTTRMRQELLPELTYPTLADGLETLR
jgi:nucleoside-diphosphate-sugar epimerase